MGVQGGQSEESMVGKGLWQWRALYAREVMVVSVVLWPFAMVVFDSVLSFGAHGWVLASVALLIQFSYSVYSLMKFACPRCRKGFYEVDLLMLRRTECAHCGAIRGRAFVGLGEDP